MCGRFGLIRRLADLKTIYQAQGAFTWEESYNICPTHRVPVLVEGENGRELKLMKWGLVPFWAKDEKIAYNMINARAETIGEKPAFRDAFRKRRCVIPASGFYEWTKAKQPWWFTPAEGIFSFAGIWDRWTSPAGETIETCAIVTTEANETVSLVHDRMPCALTENTMGAWLQPGADPQELAGILAPYPASRMNALQVSKYVNSPKNRGAECIAAVNSA